MIKTGFAYVMAVFQNMIAVVSPWTTGANSALPEPIAGFTGAYFLLNTNLSLAKKNNAVLSLGQTDGHCYHDSLKYTLKIQLYGKLQ